MESNPKYYYLYYHLVAFANVTNFQVCFTRDSFTKFFCVLCLPAVRLLVGSSLGQIPCRYVSGGRCERRMGHLVVG